MCIRDRRGIHTGVQFIAELLNTGGDLVEFHCLPAAVALDDVHAFLPGINLHLRLPPWVKGFWLFVLPLVAFGVPGVDRGSKSPLLVCTAEVVVRLFVN